MRDVERKQHRLTEEIVIRAADMRRLRWPSKLLVALALLFGCCGTFYWWAMLPRPPLFRALLSRNLSSVEASLDGEADPNAPCTFAGPFPIRKGWRPLHWAAYHQRTDIIDALLAAGADPSLVDDEGDTPLHSALQGRNGDVAIACVLALVRDRRGVNVADRAGKTALSIASERSSPEVVAILLQYGFDPDSNDSAQESPLEYALAREKWDVAEILLDSGARPEDVKGGPARARELAHTGGAPASLKRRLTP